MKFIKTDFKDCFIIEIEKKIDDRGFFARIWDKEIFKKYKINEDFIQSSISVNKKKFTLRGIHYQKKPYEESKIVRCTKGSIFDVVVDLRPDSKTYKKWISVELSSENYRMIYIPKGIAHGFQTLENNTEVLYQISEKHKPSFSSGIRWNDPQFQIKWPNNHPTLSEKDKRYPDFKEMVNK